MGDNKSTINQVNLKGTILIPRREKLLKLKSSITDPLEIDKIDKTLKQIEAALTMHIDDRTFSEAFLDEYDTMIKGEKFLNVIRPLAVKANTFSDIAPRSMRSITKSIMFELVEEFLETILSKETYNVFREFFKMRDNRVFLGDFEFPETIFLDYYRDPIIICPNRRSINDISSLAHEFGHAIHFLLGNDSDCKGDNCDDTFVEVISMTFEILFMDFLRSKKVFHTQAKILQRYYQNCVASDTREALLAHRLYDRIYEEQARHGIYIEEVDDFNSGVIRRTKLKKILEDAPAESIKYSLGYLVGIELLYAYFKDPDKAKEMIDGIIGIDINIDTTDYFYDLVDFGVSPGVHLPNYRSYLRTDRSKCFTKKL